jgi:hypothetical protein
MARGQLNLFYYVARQDRPTMFYYRRQNTDAVYRGYVWQNYTDFTIGHHYDNSGRNRI